MILDARTHVINEEMLDLIKDLYSLNFNVYVFSNTSRSVFERMDIKYGCLKYFTNIILAEDTGYSKPSNEAFEALLKVVKNPESGIIYVDDGLDNIRQAEKYGMKTVRFVDVDRLRISLHKLI